jgi:hypothetical protein
VVDVGCSNAVELFAYSVFIQIWTIDVGYSKAIELFVGYLPDLDEDGAGEQPDGVGTPNFDYQTRLDRREITTQDCGRSNNAQKNEGHLGDWLSILKFIHSKTLEVSKLYKKTIQITLS